VQGAVTPYTASTSPGETLQAFPATSYATDPASAAPPDTQLATGPGYVGEAVNDALSVWSRTGGAVGSYNLNSFFSVPSGYSFADPRIIYDGLSGRWFLSGFSVNSASDSITYLAVSDSSDPTAGWYVYDLASGAGVITDQPKIGMSSDKLVISWNAFNSTGSYLGEQTWVLQKSDLLTGSTLAETQFGLDSTRSGIVPAISESATTTEYLSYNDTCSGSAGTGTGSCTTGSPALGIVAITGTPAAGDVVWSEADPAITQTTSPPAATQPSGVSINTDDDRLLSVVWQAGILWAGGNDGCVPTGDTTTRSCARLIEVSTGGSTPTVLTDGDLGFSGADLYYPAVVLDGSGEPFVVATISSSSIYPSVVDFAKPSSSSIFNGSYLWDGSGGYSCSFCGSSGNRWGDYSGAALDPTNPTDVWVAGEYGTATGGNDWGTAIGELTLDGPTVTAVSPNSGPTAGGTSVTITGSNFRPTTSVAFGSSAADH